MGWTGARFKRMAILVVMASLFFVLSSSLFTVKAASPNVSKSYEASLPIAEGSLVSLSPDKNGHVAAATSDTASALLGIVVNKDESLLAVESQQGKVQIAISGSAPALVSTINGSIKAGDQISASPFAGIGMKAEPGARIVGLALDEFTASGKEGVDKQVKDQSGKTKTIRVGYVRVTLAVGTSASEVPEDINNLQKAAQSITGRTIATWRVVASLTVLIITFLVLVTLIYSSIYGGIIAIGRNPLAKYSIFRALGSVTVMAGGLIVVSGLLIFLLLR